MKWGVAGIFLAAFLFLSVSSFSVSTNPNYCYQSNNWSCPDSYECCRNQTYTHDGICIPENIQCLCQEGDELRENISNELGVEIDDYCSLDSDQLGVIFHVLEAVPEGLHNVSKIVTEPSEDPDVLEIYPSPRVNEEWEDKIPDNKEQHTDGFSIDFIYRLNHKIRQKMIVNALAERENQLISKALEACEKSDSEYLVSKHFLRSDFSCSYFRDNPKEFFPRISEAYFQNSKAALNLSLERFNEGYRQPINQFLFFAGVYSMGSDKTRFYSIDQSGHVGSTDVNLENIDINGIKYITSLSFDGRRYVFSLNSSGDVESISITEAQPKIQKCIDGTLYGQCSNSSDYGKPWYCNKTGQLVENCSECGCEAGFYCQDNLCVEGGLPGECEDGTPLGSCSTSDAYGKPFYCSELRELVENCSVCGCEEGKLCEEDVCVEKCIDGTPYGQCSNTKPYLCEYGELVEDCKVCGCEEGKLCEDNTCVQKCADETPWGECSKTKPWYCEEGQLVEKCSVCGCYPYSFCQPVNDSCQYSQTSGNNPPAFIHIGSKKVREGEQLIFNVSAFDIDGDTLTFNVQGLPEGMKFENLTNKMTFKWIPDYDQAGTYEVIFIVSDGKFNVSEKIEINVTDSNRKPKAGIYYPSDNQEFYADEIIRFSGKWSVDEDKDALTYFWYFGDGGTAVGMTDEHAYKEPGTYNVTLEVTDGEASDKDSITLRIIPKEEPVQDKDRDGVNDSVDRCPGTTPLERVNIYGCPLPEYTKFRNNLTTDFSKIDLINATNVTIGAPGRAKIEFRKNRVNLVKANLDKYVEIGNMSVEIKTDKIPELNKSAVVTFYNVTIKDPVILRDDEYCSDCRVISYLDGTFVFSVPHFTKYSLMAWASFSGYCGDDLCSAYETCYDCPTDCGKCKELEVPTQCNEYWVCGGWSACNELNLRTRECNDINLCGTERNKPKEVMECKEEPFPSLTLFGVMVFVLTTIYIVTERYKKKREMRKLGMYELHEIIKGYMYRGFSKKEIVKILKTKGYETKEINRLIKEVENEMF